MTEKGMTCSGYCSIRRNTDKDKKFFFKDEIIIGFNRTIMS